MSEIEDLRRDVIELREWREAVLDKCKASSGWNDLEWGGDKNGWGFVHHFIGQLNTRALEAEAQRSGVGEPFTAADAWNILVEKDDRTSPEEYPDHCLITADELRDFMERAAPAPLSRCEVPTKHPLAELPEYLECLEVDLLSKDLDMRLKDMIPPGVWADRVRAALATRPADTSEREVAIEECAKIADQIMENAISRARALDKRSRDHAKEVAREYTARRIAGDIRRLATLPASSRESGSAAQGSTAPVPMNDIVQVIANEWGSHLCYNRCSRSHSSATRCRCFDIANAIAAEYDITAKAPSVPSAQRGTP